MKNNVREILKNAIEENAVAFKQNTSNALYGKIANRLQEEYKTVAKNILGTKNETDNGTN
jgi:hypothetical protein